MHPFSSTPPPVFEQFPLLQLGGSGAGLFSLALLFGFIAKHACSFSWRVIRIRLRPR